MAIDRRLPYLLRRLSWRGVALLLAFGLTACGAATGMAGNSARATVNPATATPAPPAPTTPAGGIAETPLPQPAATATRVLARPSPPTDGTAGTPPTPSGWSSYRNEQAGYAVNYPPTWTASERSAGGSLVTSFTSATGGGRIDVIVRPGTVAQPEAGDIPNTRCRPVTIGGVSGTSCFDTLARTTSITLPARGNVYEILIAAKVPQREAVEGFLASFTFLP